MGKIKLTKSAVDAAQPQAKAVELWEYRGARFPVQNHPSGAKIFNLAEVWGLRPDGTNPCRHVPT